MVNRHQSSNIAYPSGTMTLLKIIYENIEIYENMKNIVKMGSEERVVNPTKLVLPYLPYRYPLSRIGYYPNFLDCSIVSTRWACVLWKCQSPKFQPKHSKEFHTLKRTLLLCWYKFKTTAEKKHHNSPFQYREETTLLWSGEETLPMLRGMVEKGGLNVDEFTFNTVSKSASSCINVWSVFYCHFEWIHIQKNVQLYENFRFHFYTLIFLK